jgi:hypothetical protein
LGEYFYDFYYEIDAILVGGHTKGNYVVSLDSRAAPSPKRPRFENSGITSDNSNTEHRGGKYYLWHYLTVE